jgi:hypothetical protein
MLHIHYADKSLYEDGASITSLHLDTRRSKCYGARLSARSRLCK